MKNSKESGEFEVLPYTGGTIPASTTRAMDRKSPYLKLQKNGMYGVANRQGGEDELELAKREGATRARIDIEHNRLIRGVAESSLVYDTLIKLDIEREGHLPRNLPAARRSWREACARLRDFRDRHAKLGLVLIALVLTLGGCSGGQTTAPPGVDAGSPSVTAAEQAASSHCTHISECALYNGSTTPENTCEYDETNVLQDRSFTCTEQQLNDCAAANRSPYCTSPEDFTIGGACASCFGDAS